MPGVMLLIAAAASADVAGLYQAHQMEVGAALELRANGRFRYQFDYGAVSEHAEGDWTFDGKAVRLTTRPTPRQPSFEMVRDDPAPPGTVILTLEPPGFGASYRLEAIGTDAASGEKGLVTTNSDGVVDSGKHKLSAIDPLVPVYGSVGAHLDLTPDRGHKLLLRFHANDLGIAAFDAEPLPLTAGALVLNRYGNAIRFIRARP